MGARILLSAFSLALALAVATTAEAQIGGGGGGGGGGGHGGRGGGHGQKNPAPTATTPDATPLPGATPLDKIEIVGVIKAIDPETQRITIAYEPVDALDWPKGTMPFNVAKAEVLKDAAVGEKVRFKLQSQQISELKPY